MAMSFDLGFWAALPQGVDPADAYRRLLDEETAVAVEASTAVEAFYADITATYPEPDVVEGDGDRDEDEDSPWSSGIYRTSECLVVAISWSRRDELVPFLSGLARQHRLAMYDPQSETVQLPV